MIAVVLSLITASLFLSPISHEKTSVQSRVTRRAKVALPCASARRFSPATRSSARAVERAFETGAENRQAATATHRANATPPR